YISALYISKADMVEIDAALHLSLVKLDPLLHSRLAHLGLYRENAPKPLHGNHGRLQCVPLLGNLVDRLKELANIANKRIQHAELERIVHDRPAAEPYDKGDGHIAQNVKGAVEHDGRAHL